MDRPAASPRSAFGRGFGPRAERRPKARQLGSALLRNLGIVAVVVAWCLSLGLQWPALQAVAWIKMAAGYQTRMSWVAALETAVMGPKCSLCRAIEKAKTDAGATEAPVPLPRQDVNVVIGLPPADDDAICPQVARWTWPVDPVRFASRSEQPPVPPPRSLG